MQTRSIDRDKEFFLNSVSECRGLIQEYAHRDTKTILTEGTSRFHFGIHLDHLQLSYSAGLPIPDLLPAFSALLSEVAAGRATWGRPFVGKDGRVHPEYILDTYDGLVWFLSLSALLDVDKEELAPVRASVDRDGVRDALLEFLLGRFRPGDASVAESYSPKHAIPACFATIRHAIAEADPVRAASLVGKYVQEDWYMNHRHAAWYNSKDYPGFCGYWCFEAAAVVKIRSLDDSAFRDHQYYPKDLADWRG